MGARRLLDLVPEIDSIFSADNLRRNERSGYYGNFPRLPDEASEEAASDESVDPRSSSGGCIVKLACKGLAYFNFPFAKRSHKGAKALSMESAAIDFVRDAFGHLKAIAADKGGQVILQKANVGLGAGILDANDKDATRGQGNIHQTVGVYDRHSAVT
jgi:hypothetical protein